MDGASIAYAASVSIVPWNPAFWFVQIPIFIVIVLISLFYYGSSIGTSLKTGYVAQIPITFTLAYFGFSAFKSYITRGVL